MSTRQLRASGGTPVVLSTNFLKVDTPIAWFVRYLLLWIVFFPTYLRLRDGVR